MTTHSIRKSLPCMAYQTSLTAQKPAALLMCFTVIISYENILANKSIFPVREKVLGVGVEAEAAAIINS